MDALAEYQAAIGKIRELLAPEGAASSRSHGYARSFVLAFLCGADDDDVSIDDATMTFLCNRKGKATGKVIADGVAFLDTLDIAIEKARPEVRKAFKDKGREHGARGKTAIDMFIQGLVHAVQTAGGYLATSRAAKSSPYYIGKHSKSCGLTCTRISPRPCHGHVRRRAPG